MGEVVQATCLLNLLLILVLGFALPVLANLHFYLNGTPVDGGRYVGRLEVK